MRGADAVTRLEAVAEHVAHLVDAGGWWVSEAPGGGPNLISIASSVQRSGDQSDERFAEQAKIGAVFDLRDFPVTERAVRDASSFAVELGVQGNDQDEETALVIAGLPRGHRRRCHRRRLRLADRGVRRHPDLAPGRLRAGPARARGGGRRRRGRPGGTHRRTGCS